jgi:WD40 repeat protein
MYERCTIIQAWLILGELYPDTPRASSVNVAAEIQIGEAAIVGLEGSQSFNWIDERYKGGHEDCLVVFNRSSGFDFEISLTQTLEMAADVKSVQFSPNGEYLALVCLTSIHIFHSNQTGPALMSVSNEAGEFDHRNRRLCFSPDGRHIALGCDNALINVTDVQQKYPTTSLNGHTSGISSLCYNHDGTLLISGSAGDRTIRVWDMRSLIERSKIAVHYPSSSPTGLMTFSPSGGLVAVSDGTSKVYLIDTAKGELVHSLNGPARVDRMAFSPCEQQLVGISINIGDNNDPNPILWRTDGTRTLATVDGVSISSHALEHSKVNSMSWSSDAKWLITGGNCPAGSVQFWDSQLCQPQFILNAHDEIGLTLQSLSDVFLQI